MNAACLKRLEDAVDSYIEHLKKSGPEDRDSKYTHLIFECAVLGVNGDKAFDEINELMVKRDQSNEMP